MPREMVIRTAFRNAYNHAALPCIFGKIVIFCPFYIALHIKPCIMIFKNIGSAREIISICKGTVKQKR